MIGEQPVVRTSALSSISSEPVTEIRCCSFPEGLCLLVHFRLYYRINVHFIYFVIKVDSEK